MITFTTHRLALLVAVLALAAAACTSASGAEVASLSDDEPVPATGDTPAETDVDDEDAILAFSACMRENGVEDFEDPELDGRGGMSFGFRGDGGDSLDMETMRSAMEACQEHLEGLAFGGERVDRSEIEDQLYEFAACMRDNGVDMPDPDFSGGPGEGGGPFISLDADDPEFAAAMEACEEVFGGSLDRGARPGGGAGRGPNR